VRYPSRRHSQNPAQWPVVHLHAGRKNILRMPGRHRMKLTKSLKLLHRQSRSPSGEASNRSASSRAPPTIINLSRPNHLDFSGLCRRNLVHNTYAVGAIPNGNPGCPDSAFCTASSESVRIVLIQSWSMSILFVDGFSFLVFPVDQQFIQSCVCLLASENALKRFRLAAVTLTSAATVN
jgi:hypothetical protein